MGFSLSGPVVRGIKVGDIISAVRVREKGDSTQLIRETKEYKVIHVSRHTVTAVTDRGRDKRVFSYGDLVINGILPPYQWSSDEIICNPRPGAHHKNVKKGGKQHAGRTV